jgi:inosose dehydratase
MNRRTLLKCAVAGPLGTLCARAANEQGFLVGLAASGPAGLGRGGGGGSQQPPAAALSADEVLMRIGDECSRMGVHYLEFNTTNRRLVDTWDNRISQFRDEMAKRSLTLLGLAVYSHMHDAARRKELIEHHVRVARFLKAVGGRYITQLVAPGERLANGIDEEYKRIDVKAYVANVNAVAKSVREETGIRIGYHPEQGDIRAGIHEPILDNSDPRYFDFVPDVGHIGACGLDPLPLYRKYRSRMVNTHFKDYSPDAEYERNGQKLRGRTVSPGQGIVKFPVLVQFLRESKYTGQVMAEGGGNQAMRDYLVETLKLKL